MQIAKNSVVTLHYEMFDVEGKLLDKTEEPIAYLHGGYDNILPLVEEALEGKTVGDTIEVTMEADDAFGEYEPELVRQEERSVFPMPVEVGLMFEGEDDATGEVLLFRVTEVDGDKVTVDGNHPFAGMTIVFKASVSEVRAASAEELAHGHVHGPHGHHH
ncbi:FKBP-type peptidyl-prolyl cis-trans isomerase SlyD [Andreprevotia lacus DSM 23236]|jgi:FKBP-type peptidyl-prolyl cis-trans isomerase SlyD|uniref:Peptidyl-prolyl cis-trans isomerase n=1 Tax=Andreprevotia lacus DSM 23236 TaxID=1121001 RepID=A0A1W1XPB9_9NEIS|nr:peptidylprolyl isomerase [Andreprevotia lacus]SMC25702.1 FKBP-type peptidyl-prolyl cis-trans isomerase SlyD [Andreprevotia lacus DSM 23236]